MTVQPPQAHSHEKYENNWYFRFENDNTMSYKYILSITWTWSASLTDTAPHIVKKIKKVAERTDYILGILSTEYTQQAFTHAYRIFTVNVFIAWWW